MSDASFVSQGSDRNARITLSTFFSVPSHNRIITSHSINWYNSVRGFKTTACFSGGFARSQAYETSAASLWFKGFADFIFDMLCKMRAVRSFVGALLSKNPPHVSISEQQ
jgi:hypothetical protein